MASDSTLFALALREMEGVGRVTAGRLLTHFATYADLLRTPREQVLTRIKGAPNAQALVTRLFDEAAMTEKLATAQAAAAENEKRGVHTLSPPDEAWPAGLEDLPLAQRPFLLYAYGPLEALARPLVALFARPPLSEAAFETAQALVRHLLPHGLVPATGAAHGFDVVVHKLCAGAGAPGLLVAPAGMARLAPPLRPTVTAAVRAGGLLVSPFPMTHGPFDHDDKERALTLAALARACVFFEPKPDTPEGHALTWALDAGRPVFGIAADDAPLPETVHRLREPVDSDWVVAAAKAVEG